MPPQQATSSDPPAAGAIRVRGARVHNLQNLDVDIPRNQLVVLTGPSGSGKSSLAFDTLHAESQRQYIEGLSAYARQFFHQLPRPDVDLVDGLPPTVSIDQRAGSRNPRSTVATITEIHDYLRLLYARVGQATCPRCGEPISQQSPEEIEAAVAELPAGTRALILAPLVQDHRGRHREVVASIRKAGFVRARVDGAIYLVEDIPALDPRHSHRIDAVVDRIVLREGIESRLGDSLRLALRQAEGLVRVCYLAPPADHRPGPSAGDPAAADRRGRAADGNGEAWVDKLYSTRSACPRCDVSFAELEPRTFSFNSPYGACPECDGLGVSARFDPELVLPDRRLALAQGAVAAWRGATAAVQRRRRQALEPLLAATGIPWEKPLAQAGARAVEQLLEGSGRKQLGVLTLLEKEYVTAGRGPRRKQLEMFRSRLPCSACGGARLRVEARACRVGPWAIHQLSALTVQGARRRFETLELPPAAARIAAPIVQQIVRRLGFLEQVGVHYLALDRPADTLSGGEMQRVRLATGIGSGLVGVCYLLDEPSVGLHPRDNQRLIDSLRQLQQLGSTVVVVEHDAAMIRSADQVIDMGPGAGRHGGRVVAQGSPAEIARMPASVTGRFLAGASPIPLPERRRRTAKSRSLQILGASTNNLRNIDVHFPLSALVCVTGVSGSGKSSLVRGTLAPAVARRLGQAVPKPGPHKGLRGSSQIGRLVEVSQGPIGRTPRSNAATYTGVFDEIRKAFAGTKAARQRGYRSGRFSFNVKGGRCEVCQGQGQQKIEMNFLPDLYALCPECDGARFNRQTLQVRYHDRNIAEVLAMRVDEALELFDAFPAIHRPLECLDEVGLGYLSLGQPATTLSGGEAQRVRLASELARPTTGRSLYVLDEPTTGLHFVDIERLLAVLQRLVDLGNTVVVIEHHLDVVKSADWIIDLGPEGGAEGGQVVATGTPEAVACLPDNHTSRFLRQVLADRVP